MIDLTASPFNLDRDGVEWVTATLARMDADKKIGQLFCPLGLSGGKRAVAKLTREIGIGGIMFRPDKAVKLQGIHRALQENSDIPLLIAANLETGGDGAASEGTFFGNNMLAAATGDVSAAYDLARVGCSEGAALGVNLSFAPVVDIDMNFRNPITNTRTFGGDVQRVIDCGREYIRAARERGLATAVKHFPGDGVDERDQHLLTSVNSLSREEWNATYGKVYEAMIGAGTKAVMVGHIALPAYSGDYMPSTLSRSVMTGLLREQLGFNGLIITDATPMAGFRSAMKRANSVPLTIEAGADMFLFARDLETDIALMKAGLKSGALSTRRLNEAVMRILAIKASLGLHLKQKSGELVPPHSALSVVGCKEHRALAAKRADQAVTLVKDAQNFLPVSPEKQRRVYLNVLEPDDSPNTALKRKLKRRLEAEGFAVTIRDRAALSGLNAFINPNVSIFKKIRAVVRARRSLKELTGVPSDFTDKYDWVLYVANYEAVSENTVVRLNWQGFKGMGDDAPWFAAEIPAVFVSLANPYHLLDVPAIKTFINAYAANDETIDAVIGKLTGRGAFTGISPADPFCGREDLK